MGGGAALPESVFGADIFDRNGAMSGSHLGNGVAQTADDIVLFGCDRAARLADGTLYRFAVQGFDGVNIDELDRDGLGVVAPEGDERVEVVLPDVGRTIESP